MQIDDVRIEFGELLQALRLLKKLDSRIPTHSFLSSLLTQSEKRLKNGTVYAYGKDSTADPVVRLPVPGPKANVDSAAVQQHEDLVSTIEKLENMLARVDKVVQKELVEPLIDGDQGIDDMSDDENDGFFAEMELRDYLRQQNASLRESTYLYRSLSQLNNMRRDRRNKMRPSLGKTMPDDQAAVDAEAELRATMDAQLAEMLANGIPATGSRNTWAQFQSIAPPISRLGWQGDRRKESIINLFELLVGEPESTLVGSRERNPAPRSMPVNTADARAPGETPLLERILFHSLELTGILVNVSGGMFYRGDIGCLPGIIRPFKMLVYYEKQLRDYAASLQAGDAAVGEDSPIVTLKDDVGASRTSETGRENNSSDEGVIERDNSVRLLHIRCLLDFIDNEVNARKEHLKSGHCKKVTFSDLWYLFQPGIEVIDQDNKQAYRVVRVMMPKHNTISPWECFRSFKSQDGEENLEKSAKIHCIYIDCDGEEIGPVLRTFEIAQFDQEKMIEALPIYPLRMVREAGFRDRLVERGKMLWAVIQVKPMYYAGHTIDIREEADSQVMIDFREALIHASEHDKEWKPHVDVTPTSFEEVVDPEKKYCHSVCCYGQVIHDESYVEVKQTEEFIQSQLERSLGDRASLMLYPQTIGEILDANSTPNKDELILMSYRAFGFILRSRKWAQLDLTYMKYENEANRTNVLLSAFDRLILPEGHKEMV
ncbi:hypothetical protein INS49_009287 [Diaporthe citri]|uniref:uncharacterized protein n=1 Tax=Diaporthe citri TaxID=83186 RepID=UPI001C7F53BD|nr:uncharacterized protein INS49_009287 [Diaporthe citri]KAG6361066.1 hypothetical protein INS49_009287 [Diaporthe citri]